MTDREKTEKPSVQLVSRKELEDRYRALLMDDWSLRHLEKSLDLIRDQLLLSGLVILFPWDGEPPKKKQPERPKPQRISPNAAEYVREFVEHFDTKLPEVPTEMPARRDEEKVQMARLAERASVYLTVQNVVRLSGASRLLADAQSLVFSTCVHVLLPELRAREMADESDLLLNSLWMHVKLAWDDEPSHKYFLQSQFFAAVDMPEPALEALHKSFMLTPSQEHDWITKAQAVWAGLVEAKRLHSAKDFLLHTLRIAPAEHVPELTEMIDETYQYIHHAPRGRGRGGSKGRAS